MNKLRQWTIGGALSTLLLSVYANTFEFNTVIVGPAPGGSAPWARIILTDTVGGVQVSLTHLTTDPGEPRRIGRLHLRFSTIPTGFNSLGDPFVSGHFLGNHFVADAGLSFNAYVDFNVSPPRLTQGNTSTFEFLGVSKSDFNFQEPTSGMIHMFDQRGSENSKIIAPEPASMMALGVGLFGLLGLRRRKR